MPYKTRIHCVGQPSHLYRLNHVVKLPRIQMTLVLQQQRQLRLQLPGAALDAQRTARVSGTHRRCYIFPAGAENAPAFSRGELGRLVIQRAAAPSMVEVWPTQTARQHQHAAMASIPGEMVCTALSGWRPIVVSYLFFRYTYRESHAGVVGLR